MNRHVNRRSFLKTAGAVGAGVGLAGLAGSMPMAAESVAGAPNAEKLGWRLGCGSWTFHVYPLFEAIDKTAALGLKYFETGPCPKLSKAEPNVGFDEHSPPRVRRAVKKKLADSGLTLLSYGAISYTQDINRKTFDFAKDMGTRRSFPSPAPRYSTRWINCAKSTI